MKRILAASVLGAMGIAGSAFGGGIDPSWVDSDAGWVAHVDVEGLMRSELGGAMIELFGDDVGRVTFEELMEMLEDGVEDEDMALAVMREVRDVTVVGKDDDEPDLVVARTSAVVHAMIEAMKHQDGFNLIQRDGHSILSFMEDDEDEPEGYAVVLPTVDKDTYRVVMSDTVDKLIGSVAASHTRRDAPAWIGGAAGKLVFLHMSDPTRMAGGDMPGMLQDVGAMEFSLAEKGGMLDANLMMETGDAQAATDMVAACNGFIAMGRMMAGSDPEMAELVRLTSGLTMRADGTSVLANLSLDVGAMLDTIGPMIDIDEDEISVHIDVDVDEDEENEME